MPTDCEQDAVALEKRQAEKRCREGGEPVAERDRQRDDDGEDKRDDADDTVACLRQNGQ